MNRVLVICYYWPPAGGPGVQRWLKFIKYLPDFQINPVVYIPKNPHYPIIDHSLTEEVPEDLEILRYPIKEPYRYAAIFSRKKTKQMSSGILESENPSFLARVMQYIRGNFFIPDARVGWVKPSVNYLKEYLSRNPDIQTIITTGPPHSLHLIGMKLKKETGVQWIADFRDPWTTIHYHQSLPLTKKSKEKHKYLEQEVLQTADRVVVTSPSTQKEFQLISGRSVELITNGFDDDSVGEVSFDEKFSIVHIGSLLKNRNPEILWEVLSEMIYEIPELKKDLEIKLVGVVAEDILKHVNNKGLQDQIVLPGYVAHDEAIVFQKAAQLLLLIEMDRAETKAIIPGKLFEYLRAQRPILAFGPEGSDIAPILQETQSGHFFKYTEKDRLKAILLQYYHAYKSASLRSVSKDWERYHRRNLTAAYATLIESL